MLSLNQFESPFQILDGPLLAEFHTSTLQGRLEVLFRIVIFKHQICERVPVDTG